MHKQKRNTRTLSDEHVKQYLKSHARIKISPRRGTVVLIEEVENMQDKEKWGVVKVSRTYYLNGFFNETKNTPRFPCPDDYHDSNVILECVGPRDSVTAEASVCYKGKGGKGEWINPIHSARIFGRTALARWFHSNIEEGDRIKIEVIAPLERYRITPMEKIAPLGDSPRAEESSVSYASSPTPLAEGATTPRVFEELAADVMGAHFGVKLNKRKLPGVPKEFDMVSDDGSVVGDAKYFTMVRGTNLPPAKFSVIAEHVWLLEKTEAKRKFLVFGNDRRVPEEWLRRYGHLAGDVEFWFLETGSRKLQRLA